MRIWFPAEKCNSSYINFGFLGKKLCRKIFGTVRHGRKIWLLNVQRIYLKTKQISRRNMTFLTFYDLERKNIWLLTTFLLHFWQNCVLRLQGTIWQFLFDQFSISSSISRFEKKIIFSRNTIVAVAKSAFHAYRWQFDKKLDFRWKL